MITVVIIKNAFEPENGREVHQIEYEKDKTVIADYINPFTAVFSTTDGDKDPEFTVTLNSYTSDSSAAVSDGDFIVLAPYVGKGGGKNPLLIIATVALSVFSMGIGANVAGLGYSAMSLAGATGWAAIGGYLAAAAVMFIGGTLIQKAFGTAAGTAKYSSENPTYNWSGIRTTEGQGNAISEFYGTVRTGGQTIGKYLSTVDDKQYLNWLVAVGEGPLTISDIQLNDNPVGNYDGVTVETREGSNTQSIISNFNDTISTKTLGYEVLSTSYRTDIATGTATQGLIIFTECSNGLYYANDKGGLDTAWVQIMAQYAKVGTSDWKSFVGPSGYVADNPYGISLRDNATAGNYGVKIRYFFGYIFRIGGYTGEFNGLSSTDVISVGPFSVDLSATTKEQKKALMVTGTDTSDKGTITVVATEGGAVGNGRISGNKSSAIRREFRIDGLEAGSYQVRVRVVARSHGASSTRACTRVWWSAVGGIVYDDFSYPNMALIGIKALATDQISGSPTMKFMVNRPSVYVWNPNTSAYETHDATNPAWASYDMVHQCKYLQNRNTGNWEYLVKGAKAELMQYDKFAEWASFCDTFNLKINIEINTTGELISVVNTYIGAVGRGMVELFGTKYGCVWDGPKEVTQMFGMGNIRSGTFEESFMQTSDRANAVEITFTNAQKDYDRDSVKVYSPAYDTDEYDNSTQISYDGITDYKQAYREGRFQLECNRRMIRAVSFEADIDAIACTLGDRIYVANDVPKWATSGHITAVTNNVVTVNAPISDYDATKTYRFAYRASSNDTRYESVCNAVTIDADSTTVTLSTIPDVPPAVGDIFDIAEKNIGTKSFVVRSISRAQDMVRKIEALEYSDAVFSEDYDIPDVDYTTAKKNTAVNVVRLAGNQRLWTSTNGEKQSRMYLSWAMPTGYGFTRFIVSLSSDGGLTWIPAGTTERMSIELSTAYGTVYQVKVVTVYGVSVSTGATANVAPGVDDPPDDVTALNCELMATGTRRYWWSFTYPDINDIAGFCMKYTQGQTLNWDAGIPVQDGLITMQPYETQTVRQGTHAVMIKAVDNAGNESTNYAYCILDMGDLLEQNVLYTVDFSADNWAAVTYDGTVDTYTGWIYPVNKTYYWKTTGDYFWVGTANNHWAANWQSYTVTATFIAPASGQFWLSYSISGPAIVYYRKVGEHPAWEGADDAAWVDAEEAIWDDTYDLWKQYSDRLMVSAGDNIQVRIAALNGASEVTIVKGLKAVIDVPDITEHFEDITVPALGLSLPVKTPHYYTTAVRIDAINGKNENNAVAAQIVTRNPCKIKLLNSAGENVSGIIDCTWQGL